MCTGFITAMESNTSTGRVWELKGITRQFYVSDKEELLIPGFEPFTIDPAIFRPRRTEWENLLSHPDDFFCAGDGRCKDSSKDVQQEYGGAIYRCNARAVSRCWLSMLGRLMLRQRSNVFMSLLGSDQYIVYEIKMSFYCLKSLFKYQMVRHRR